MTEEIEKPKRNWLKNAAVFLGASIIGIGIVESGLRLLVPWDEIKVEGVLYQPHEEALFAVAPNAIAPVETPEFSFTYRTNSIGLRDREFGAKSDGVFRIACLGDSMTMGYGVEAEDTYPKVLEGLLNERLGEGRVEVINMGVSNYGPWQSNILFRERGLALEPDLVIYQVLPENDVRDELQRDEKLLRAYSQRHIDEMDKWRADRWERRLWDMRGTSRTYDVLFPFLRPRLSNLAHRLRGEGDESSHPESVPRPAWLEVFLTESYPMLDFGWVLLEESLMEMQSLCADSDVDLMALYVPSAPVVDDARAARIMEKWGTSIEGYDFGKTSEWFKGVAQRRDLEWTTTLPTLKENVGDGAEVYFELDGHPTTLGHRIIAEHLADYLLEHNFADDEK